MRLRKNQKLIVDWLEERATTKPYYYTSEEIAIGTGLSRQQVYTCATRMIEAFLVRRRYTGQGKARRVEFSRKPFEFIG